MFRRRSLVEISNSLFFPCVTDHSQVYNLHLGFGHAVVQFAQPKPTVLRFRKNRLVIATRLRNNSIILVQIDTPLAPAILQLFKLCRRIGQVNAVTDKANILIQRTVLVNIFSIVSTFTRVVFGSVNIDRRVTFIFQIIVVIIAGNISRRTVRIQSAVVLFDLTVLALANPFYAFFFSTAPVIQALVVQGCCRTQIVFTIIQTVRGLTVNRKVFTHQTEIKINGAHITARHHFDVFHVAQVLVVATVRAHNTTPRITRQVVIGTQGHLENGQVLVIDIGITHRRINILVQFRIVTVPNKFALVLVVQALNISQRIRFNTTRRRCLVPRKSSQRIRKARSSRFKIFDQRRLFIARVRIMAASRKFSLETPAGLRCRVDTRNKIHQFSQSRHGILQAEVHSPQHARIRFVTESRGLCRCALALVQSGNTEHRTRAQAIQVKRKFGASTQQQLVVYFEQRFAFVSDLDFLVRVKSAFTQEFNLAKFIVDFVVRTANKGCRTRRHLFSTRRNIHTGTTAHRIARARITNAQSRATALTHRFEIETVRVARKVIDRQRIQLSHRCGGIQITQRLQAVLLGQISWVTLVFINRIFWQFTREPHFTGIVTRSIFLKNCCVIY